MMIKKLTRRVITQFKKYKPSPTLKQLSDGLKMPIDSIIKLDAGENQSVRSLLPKINLNEIDLTRYPDANADELLALLGQYTGMNAQNIACGNGSDELIDLLIRVFVEPGDQIIICPPTFSMYEFYGQLAEADVIKVNRNFKLEVVVDKVLSNLSRKTKLIFIDSPGNPAGTVIDLSAVEKLCQTNCIVVIDEAYIEYASCKSAISLINKYKNLVVLRTLSKWAGLAGLRLGYLVANSELIQIITAIKSPYNVNCVAQAMGMEVIKNPQPILQQIAKIVRQRNQLIKKLSTINELFVYPSSSAYVVFKPKKYSIESLNQFLLKKGIVLKRITQPVIGDCLRVNIGTKQEMAILVSTLKKWSKSLFDAIIFDMDGVLIDVTTSYRLAIEKTANLILGGNEINQKDVSLIKKIPGFNNDWDTSMALIKLIKDGVPRSKWQVAAPKLLPIVRNGEEYMEVYNCFQTFYLGSRDQLNFQEGLINTEKRIISIKLLAKLSSLGIKMAIATGRPRSEAFTAIKLAGIAKYFNARNVIGLEDVANEKPAPDSLLLARSKVSATRPIYIGDTDNDRLAAKAAEMVFYKISIDGEKKSFKDVNECLRVLI